MSKCCYACVCECSFLLLFFWIVYPSVSAVSASKSILNAASRLKLEHSQAKQKIVLMELLALFLKRLTGQMGFNIVYFIFCFIGFGEWIIESFWHLSIFMNNKKKIELSINLHRKLFILSFVLFYVIIFTNLSLVVWHFFQLIRFIGIPCGDNQKLLPISSRTWYWKMHFFVICIRMTFWESFVRLMFAFFLFFVSFHFISFQSIDKKKHEPCVMNKEMIAIIVRITMKYDGYWWLWFLWS